MDARAGSSARSLLCLGREAWYGHYLEHYPDVRIGLSRLSKGISFEQNKVSACSHC